MTHAAPTPDNQTAPGQPLDGSGSGSDTRAGSLQGGSATGSENDPAQAASDRHLRDLGPELKGARREGDAPRAQPDKGVTNIGAQPNLGPHGDPAEGKREPGDDADAATG